MNRHIRATRATEVRAYACNPDGVIVEVTIAPTDAAPTKLPPFQLSRAAWAAWAAMVSNVNTALSIPAADN